MKAIKVFEKGDADVLKMVETDKPRVKPGWSLVKVMAFGVNRSEIFTRLGYSESVKFPRILGIECVGVIEETSDSERLPVNTRVCSIMGEMGRAFDGSYAEYVLLPNEQIYTVKTDLPWSDFASIPETGYTAFGSLKNLRIKEGDKVLVRGATSGVGIAFAKLLKRGYPRVKLFGSTRNMDKADKLRLFGYDEIILDNNGKLETDESFDKVLELIGPATVKDSIAHMSEGGTVCSTGLLGRSWYLEEFDPTYELRNSIYLTTFYSGNVSERRIQEMFDYIDKYNIEMKPEKVFALEEIRDAHRYLEGKDSFGKVVVVNDR